MEGIGQRSFRPWSCPHSFVHSTLFDCLAVLLFDLQIDHHLAVDQ